MRKTVAIAGASGFIGSCLIEVLRPDYDIIALSRGSRASEPGLEWRRCDLYSLLQSEAALKGADYAIYLVQATLPTARLTQGSFADTDLILADNFVRAARKAGVRQIVYLGNLIPLSDPLPAYLRSRLEVEQVLGAYGVPMTALRMPILLGAQGAPLALARAFAARVPLVLAPRWMRTPTQPLALLDLEGIVAAVLANEADYGQTYEIAGPQVMSYRELIEAVARAEGRPMRLIDLPLDLPRLSRWAAARLTGIPEVLLMPLIESLRLPSLPDALVLQARIGQAATPPGEAIAEALSQPQTRALPVPQRGPRDVRSVQRLPLPPGKDADWLANQYTLLLPRLLRPFIQVRHSEGRIGIYQTGLFWPMLELSYAPERSSPDRALFYITGGLLAKQTPGFKGRLEFRVIPGGRFALAGIHEFTPSVPWLLYRITQARFHLWTMKAFIKYLDGYREETGMTTLTVRPELLGST